MSFKNDRFNELNLDIQTQISTMISKENENENVDKILQDLKEENNYVFYIVEDGNIIGSLQIDTKLILENISKILYFIIDDKKRGKGYGKRLLSQTLNASIKDKQLSNLNLYLMVRTEKSDTNTVAIKLYQKFGFKMTELKVQYSDGENTIMLKYNK